MAVMTRGVLYRRIDAMRRKYGIRGRFDPFAFAAEHEIPVQYHAFSNPALKGILVRSGGACGVVLDPRLSQAEQRLTLTHELVHLELHYGEQGTAFSHHSGMEYQADEGAAELLMPYRDLLPRAAAFRRRYRQDPVQITGLLAAHYRVDLDTMRRRLESLDYELMCFLRGTPVSEIIPLSRQEKQHQAIPDRQFRQTPRTTRRTPDIFPDEE
ncbi:MAG: ImmA/IrrE family metallo-endopeptidase [Ruminococcaceae bacterium]|nr:ImmA/IrrE family metallo-endopeptidase [Oscillospiraceae bacterium]